MWPDSLIFLYQVLRQKLHRSFKNIKIVSNRMIFNKDGHLVSFRGILLIAIYFVCLCSNMRGNSERVQLPMLCIYAKFFPGIICVG